MKRKRNKRRTGYNMGSNMADGLVLMKVKQDRLFFYFRQDSLNHNKL